jgi:hypothetical protein
VTATATPTAARLSPTPTRAASPVAPPTGAPGAPSSRRRAPTDPHYFKVMDIILGVDGKPGDIDAFWRSEFLKLWPGKQYLSPRKLGYYYPGEKPNVDARCIADVKDPAKELANNAFQCDFDVSISWDENFLWTQFKEIGDMAPVAVIAHEWGHHIQALSERPAYSIQAELQADCYAGLYARHADRTGKLDPGDIQEASDAFFTRGDKDFDQAGWFLPGVHGTPLQRRLAFLAGYEAGAGARCLTYGKFGAADTVALGPYQLALAPGTRVERRPSGTITLETVEGKLEARQQPNLPGQSAKAQLPGVSREWFGSWTGKMIGAVETLEMPRLGGTAAFQYYEQEIVEKTGKRTVHGIIFLHVRPGGGGLLMDFYAPGAAPTPATGWRTLEDRMTALLLGLGQASGPPATPTPAAVRSPTPIPRKP